MPTNNITDSCKVIQDAWDLIKRDFFTIIPPNHYLDITCVYRSPMEQFELFMQGRTMGMDGEWHVEDKDKVVTNVDGYKILGAHNYFPARAIDVCVKNNQTGEVLWDTKWYKPLIDIVKKYNLIEGGTWRAIKDWPHIEVQDYKNYVEK